MKAETQIEIGRGAAFARICLCSPVAIVSTIPHIALLIAGEYPLNLVKYDLVQLVWIYFLFSPLIALYCVFVWSLKRRKRTLATILLVLVTLPGVFSFIFGQKLLVIFDIVVFVLLLQGILGLRKLQTTSPLVSESAPPADSALGTDAREQRKMNKKQKVGLWLCIAAFMLIGYQALDAYSLQEERVLMMQWFIVAVITGGLIVTFQDKKQKKDEQKQ